MAKQQQDESGGRSRGGSRAEQVRSAVDQALQAASSQLTRERAQDIADELAAAAGRVREALEDLKPPSGDELRRVDERIAGLEKRIAALEAATGTAPPKATARRAPTRRPAAAAAKKPAAKKPAGRTPPERGS